MPRALDVWSAVFYVLPAKTPMIRNGSTGDWIGTFVGHKGAVWGVALDDTGLLAATGVLGFQGVSRVFLLIDRLAATYVPTAVRG